MTYWATAMRGQVFESKDVQTLSNSPSVLISENFGRGGSVVILLSWGGQVVLNGAAFTVIGITGHDFVGAEMEVPDLWMPMQQRLLLHPSKNPLQDREARSCRIFGRLSRGITMGEAQAEMAGMAEHRDRCTRSARREACRNDIYGLGHRLDGNRTPGCSTLFCSSW